MAGFFRSLAFPLLESMDIEQIRLTRILRVLKERGALPLNIELTPVADGFFASVFDQVSSDIISEAVSIGFDASPALASLKGVVKFWRDAHFIQVTKVVWRLVRQTGRTALRDLLNF
jgi:hypothetical protein